MNLEVQMKSLRMIVAIALILSLSVFAFAGDDEKKTALGAAFDNGYLVFESEDASTKYWIDGRIMLDIGKVFSDVNEVPWGTETRRVRMAMKVIQNNVWAGELDIDFADNEPEIKDLWMAYLGIDNTIIKLGNHKLPGSFEEVTSSRYISFMERALMNAFAHDRRIGLSVTNYSDMHVLQAGIYGQEPGTGEEEDEDEAIGYGFRGVFKPIVNETTVAHLGASWSTSQPMAGDSNKVRFRGREVHLMDRFVNTGKVKYVEDYNLTGLEAAFRMGSVSVQGEYMMAKMVRPDAVDAEFSGYYTYVSWFPFGGFREYDNAAGEFAAVTQIPEKGAIELLARYSNLNLNDADAGVEGGEGNYITLGINYYVSKNIKLMVNYVMTDHDEFADSDEDWIGADNHNILAARFFYVF
jgi:phosphate-selective porin OprO/OprP